MRYPWGAADWLAPSLRRCRVERGGTRWRSQHISAHIHRYCSAGLHSPSTQKVDPAYRTVEREQLQSVLIELAAAVIRQRNS
jgi:hypothetical protein